MSVTNAMLQKETSDAVVVAVLTIAALTASKVIGATIKKAAKKSKTGSMGSDLTSDLFNAD